MDEAPLRVDEVVLRYFIVSDDIGRSRRLIDG
jgi:hypothetical protein